MSVPPSTTKDSKPECFALDCSNEGAFTCKRCKIARYCSSSCQQKCWAEHKKSCKGKVEAPYRFDYSNDRMIPEKKWLLSDMKKAPEQPMDLPEEYDYFSTWWNDRTVEIGGKVVVESSFFPPKMKEVIRKGLRNRDLTWDYLFSDNFMSMMAYAWVPLQYMLEHMLWVAIPAEEMPRLQGVAEMVTEHYWRVRGLAGQMDYDPQVAALLQKHKITLPFSDSHCYEDALRLYTHDLSECPNFGPQCDCFSCAVRPYKEARAREAWEVLRRRVAKKGMYMMSWSAKEEYEQKANADSAAGIDASSKVTVLQWTHGPDEQKTVKSSFTKAELTELGKYIDTIHKQQRLPLDEELDWIMRKVSVSRDRYQQETRRDIDKAVTARSTTTTTSTTATATSTTPNTSGGKKGAAKGAARSATATVPTTSTTSTTSSTTATTNMSTIDPHTPQQSTDHPPAVSGVKSGATISTTTTNTNSTNSTDTTNNTTSTTSSADGVEQCAAQLSSVAIAQSSGVGSTGSGGVYTSTGRPQRRAAAKVVSYVAAGPSSSEDEHHRRDSADEEDEVGSEAGTGAGTSGGKKGRKGKRGGGSVSGASEGWSDTSEVETSSSDGSDEASSEGEESECEGDGVGSGSKGSSGQGKGAVKRAGRVHGGGASDGKPKVKKSREHGAEGDRSVWNDEKDTRLTEAVRLYSSKNWARVAEHMGGGLTGPQCQLRWSKHLGPLQQGLRKGEEWTEVEVAALPELVQRHTIAPYWSEQYKVMTQERIDWATIGKELGRVPIDCMHKWNSILASKMKKGPFSAEEDALIRQRVVEWGDKGNGLWVQLEKEMCRPRGNIGQRWKMSLSKKT